MLAQPASRRPLRSPSAPPHATLPLQVKQTGEFFPGESHTGADRDRAAGSRRGGRRAAARDLPRTVGGSCSPSAWLEDSFGAGSKTRRLRNAMPRVHGSVGRRPAAHAPGTMNGRARLARRRSSRLRSIGRCVPALGRAGGGRGAWRGCGRWRPWCAHMGGDPAGRRDHFRALICGFGSGFCVGGRVAGRLGYVHCAKAHNFWANRTPGHNLADVKPPYPRYPQLCPPNL
jgi:hypothetical protein